MSSLKNTLKNDIYDCEVCDGTGSEIESYSYFDTVMDTWMPAERAIGPCPACSGTGEKQPTEEPPLYDDHTVYYTDASERYDYPGTKHTDSTYWFSKSGKQQQIREVWIPNERIEYQLGRYGSGLHIALTAQAFSEWKEEGLLDYRPDRITTLPWLYDKHGNEIEF